jgi:hypothetical protein
VKAATARRTGVGASSRESAASAASKHCLLAWPIRASAGPHWAARSHGSWVPGEESHTGSAAAMAASVARSSPVRAVATAAGTIQSSPRCASIIRISMCPRGRTGGNSVDRW